jgi:hypothetical protein
MAVQGTTKILPFYGQSVSVNEPPVSPKAHHHFTVFHQCKTDVIFDLVANDTDYFRWYRMLSRAVCDCLFACLTVLSISLNRAREVLSVG